MQLLNVKAKSVFMKIMQTNCFKMMAILAVLITGASQANAQHCPDCSVNIRGPQTVRVGETHTYYVTPNFPDQVIEATWNAFGPLAGGTIIDAGVDANGDQFCTVYFYQENWTWLDYEGYSGFAYDYDELPITILP